VTAQKLSLAAARRIALAAQGFAEPRPAGPVDRGHLLRLLKRLALHQIDSVNVIARAHYLPAFARLGAYDRFLLDSLAWGRPKRLFEYWAHEASLLPFDLHPLLRWRMARAESGEGLWRSMKAFAGERRAEAEAVLARIATQGPMAASDFDGAKGAGGWWGWSHTKAALEYLFWTGRITTATRRASFERVYDLAEHAIPAAILALPTPAEADAQRALVERSARALGIATAADLRDYFRLSPADAVPRIAELVEAGTLLPVAVEGWRQPAFLHVEARRPRRIEARALLAPFDPLIWDRSRTERLFGLRYRIEIYTPAHKRVHGYYRRPHRSQGRPPGACAAGPIGAHRAGRAAGDRGAAGGGAKADGGLARIGAGFSSKSRRPCGSAADLHLAYQLAAYSVMRTWASERWKP
jgi:uncharacterized protein YcaQ